MSTEALSWAFRQARANTPQSRLALILLADMADQDGVAIITPHLFASDCRVTLDLLRIVIRDLLDLGLIAKVSDPRIKNQTSVAYQIMSAAA